MKLAVFSAKPYDRKSLNAAQTSRKVTSSKIEISFLDFPLNAETASLAKGAEAVCVFVNDVLSADVLEALVKQGVRAILLRCAGYNNVDLPKAEELGLFVANVPSYSPEAVAEFAMTLLQTLNRKTHRAYNRVREGNFSLDGLLGRTLHGKTVGIIGTGRIGLAFARIMAGMGCEILAHDLHENEALKPLGEYTSLENLLSKSDFISLHCPLMDATKHLINDKTLSQLKKGAILVNTSRGGLVHTKSAIAALKRGQLGGLALDVYEGEGALFYNDHSQDIIEDDDLMRLMTFPNVIVCGHQAFFTEEALSEIANTTFSNLEDWLSHKKCANSLVATGQKLTRRDSHPVRI